MANDSHTRARAQQRLHECQRDFIRYKETDRGSRVKCRFHVNTILITAYFVVVSFREICLRGMNVEFTLSSLRYFFLFLFFIWSALPKNFVMVRLHTPRDFSYAILRVNLLNISCLDFSSFCLIRVTIPIRLFVFVVFFGFSILLFLVLILACLPSNLQCNFPLISYSEVENISSQCKHKSCMYDCGLFHTTSNT